MRPTPPFPQHPNGHGGGMRSYRPNKGNRGTPRNATEPEGTPKFGYPALESVIYWRIPPKLCNILLSRTPHFSQHPSWERRGGCETTDQTNGAPRNAKERRGAIRILKERLNLAIPHWNPPYFGGFPPKLCNIFAANTPLSPTPKWERGGMRNYRPNKGAPRNATEPDGTPKFGYPAPESTIFWRISPKLCNTFLRRPPPPFPNTRTGKWRNAKLPTQQMGAVEHHGAQRHLTERLNLAILESAIFGGCLPNSLIFLAPKTPIPNTQAAELRPNPFPNTQLRQAGMYETSAAAIPHGATRWSASWKTPG